MIESSYQVGGLRSLHALVGYDKNRCSVANASYAWVTSRSSLIRSDEGIESCQSASKSALSAAIRTLLFVQRAVPSFILVGLSPTGRINFSSSTIVYLSCDGGRSLWRRSTILEYARACRRFSGMMLVSALMLTLFLRRSASKSGMPIWS